MIVHLNNLMMEVWTTKLEVRGVIKINALLELILMSIGFGTGAVIGLPDGLLEVDADFDS